MTAAPQSTRPALPPLPEALVMVRDTDDEPENGGWIVDCDCEGPLSYSLAAGEALFTADQLLTDRRQIVELCAAVCIEQGRRADNIDGEAFYIATGQCAAALLALLDGEVK